MKVEKAIETMEYNKRLLGMPEQGNGFHKNASTVACDVAMRALEKQAFFENEVMEIRNWFANNKDCLYDSATKVAKEGFEMLTDQYKLIDETDLEAITEDIVDEIQKGILNVLDTFKDSGQSQD